MCELRSQVAVLRTLRAARPSRPVTGFDRRLFLRLTIRTQQCRLCWLPSLTAERSTHQQKTHVPYQGSALRIVVLIRIVHLRKKSYRDNLFRSGHILSGEVPKSLVTAALEPARFPTLLISPTQPVRSPIKRDVIARVVDRLLLRKEKEFSVTLQGEDLRFLFVPLLLGVGGRSSGRCRFAGRALAGG